MWENEKEKEEEEKDIWNSDDTVMAVGEASTADCRENYDEDNSFLD